MRIEQFKNEYLSHYSYAISSEDQIVVIDPARDPKHYYDYAREENATIVAVIETHPHADFVSSHLEIHETTGAKIYSHSLSGVAYPQVPFDEGDEFKFGRLKLKCLHTPGHSPDSISVVLEYKGADVAVFTGDTLFIGDCGRPDLRTNAGNMEAERAELARQMYHTLRDKLMVLGDDVLVYPAHGAGSLCGKALSSVSLGSIGNEKLTNWSLQPQSEADFVRELTTDLPFIPKYFSYDVQLNCKGAPGLEKAFSKVIRLDRPTAAELNPDLIVVDARAAEVFKKGFLPNAINLMPGTKFETWLGSIIDPGQRFYLSAATYKEVNKLIARTASIGYESFIEAAFISVVGTEVMPEMPLDAFIKAPESFTVVDLRNTVEGPPIFKNALRIPLGELSAHIQDIPLDKPVVVHCAGGYRSAVGSSILAAAIDDNTPVYDLGEAVKELSS